MFLFADFLVFSLAFIALTMFTRALRNKSINRRHPPSLPSLPIVGSLPFIRKFDNIPEFFMSKVDQLGPIFTFNVGRSYLAKVGPDYDHEQLIYTVRDFLAAGYETTAGTLLWLLVFVANNPEIQERLQKEIDAVIPKHRLPSLDDQPKLPFVEAAILETLRFRTAIPIAIPHLTLTDSEVCGYIIPAGTKVLPNLQAAHMDPKVWKDPDVFRPERFLDKDNNIIGRDEVIPFSLGRRSCLGEILARQEMFLFFAGWIQRFNILLGEDGQQIDDTPIVKVTTKPRPFKIRMIPRDI